MEKCPECEKQVSKTYRKKYYQQRFCWACHQKLPIVPPGKRGEIIQGIKDLESRWNNKDSLRRWNHGHGYNF